MQTAYIILHAEDIKTEFILSLKKKIEKKSTTTVFTDSTRNKAAEVSQYS